MQQGPGSNLGPNTSYPEVFMFFPVPQENSGTQLKNQNHFFHHPFQFITHQSPYHLALHSPKLTVSSNNTERERERERHRERDSKNIIMNCLQKPPK
jgi:hypothetical protein